MCHSVKQRSCITPCILRLPCFKHSRILFFYFSSSLSSWRTIGPWSLGMENAHLLLPQDHPRDSLTHRGGRSPNGCVALGPETAVNSPLLLFTLLTLPFCIHGSQQRPKTAQSRVPESLILDQSFSGSVPLYALYITVFPLSIPLSESLSLCSYR